jgi:hypothetical protein
VFLGAGRQRPAFFQPNRKRGSPTSEFTEGALDEHQAPPDRSELIMGAPKKTKRTRTDRSVLKGTKRTGTYCSKSELTIRSELLPPKWPKYVSKAVVPTRKSKGVGAWLARQIVAHTYTQKAYRNKVNLAALNDDEKFACAATMWTEAVSVLQYQGTGYGSSAKAERMARRMYGCYPPGYKFGSLWRERPTWDLCHHELCPYCYARRVVGIFVDLDNAFKHRPEGSEIWISAFYTFDNRKEFAKKLRKIRPACAAAFYLPTGQTDGEDGWKIHGVMMTDDPEKFQARKYKRRIYNSKQIAMALSIWMRYPRPWYSRGVVQTARPMAHLFASLPDGKQRYATFGAARADCVPGSSFMDWKAYDAGVPQGVIEEWERKRAVKVKE